MVRKLSLMLVLTLGLAPLAAQALGLGDIRPNSALNQAFNAEIKLTSVSKGEIDDVRVSMASDEAFKRSGVDRTFLLSRLRFNPEIKADGTAIIRVTSSEPIREPFLNFLVEVNWPKGRLVREYTVLLDPPVTLERKPAPIKAPAVTKTKKRVAPAKKLVQRAKPVKPVTKKPVISAPTTLMQSVHPGYTGILDEVKVKKNASLWVIARKHKYPGVDQHRMMMAIYHANPRAFIKNNINRLKQGAILRIPNKKDILALKKREAQREYKKHVEAWHADTEIVRLDPGPAPAPEPVAEVVEQEQPAEAKEPEVPAAEPVAETETKTMEESAPEEDGELKIATARPEGEGEAGPSEDSEADQTMSRLKQELMIAEEDAERSRGEGEELASRVGDLEGQLEDIERLLELKSDQLANMQAALAKSKQEKGFLEQSNQQLKGELAHSQEQGTAEPAQEETKQERVVAAVKPESAVEETKPEPVVASVKPESVIKPIADTETAPAKPKPAPVAKKSAPEPGLMDEIMGNPTMLGVVVGVIIILLALVWILLSRKRANATDFQESILLNTLDDEESDALVEADDIPSHTEETSFLSDFSPSDIDALQDETGEVDPLSEADVYIAYGRYQQAEELIRQAIEKEPERGVLKYKLFEILYATKNADGYTALAEESAGTPVESSDSESWTKVLSMGKMLSSEHPLFASADVIDSEDDLFTLNDDLLDEELDENDFADLDATLTQADFSLDQEGSETDTDAAVIDDNLLDSELLNLSNELNATDGSQDAATADLENLGFSTSLGEDSLSVALDDPDGQEPIGEQQADELEADDDLMLSLSDLEDESEKTVLSMQAETDMGQDSTEEVASTLESELTDDASVLEQELLANELEETVIDFPEAGSEKAEFVLDDDPLAELDEAGDMDVSISIDEDMQDEVKTKLDLARAYAEMGDKDGAVDILDEVLGEGNESQKQEAQQIKESLT